MGRRINTSQPTVIQTILTPLSDSFYIEPNDTLEQWYYVNTGEYSPDRTETPLRLTPVIECVDTGTSTIYKPVFSSVVWFYFDLSNNTDYSGTYLTWPGLHWVPVTAVEAETGGVRNDYYCPTVQNQDFKLYVQKNVEPPSVGSTSAGQQICCTATYVDPRDSGVTVLVEESILLATNKDATADMLSINLLAPTKTIFNPVVIPLVENPTGDPYSKGYYEYNNQSDSYVKTSDRSVVSGKNYYDKDGRSIMSFSAQVLDNKNTDVTSSYYIEWYGKLNGSVIETLINQLDCYTAATQQTGKGQGTDTITIDAMYFEKMDIVCKIRKTSSSAILPPRDYCSVVWEYPKIDAQTTCKNGRKVDSVVRDMTFFNIVNHNKKTLTVDQKSDNLLFNFKKRVSSSSSMTDIGWGQEVKIPSSQLMQTTTYSTPVHAEVYMLGPMERSKEEISANVYEDVTDDGEIVYDRL